MDLQAGSTGPRWDLLRTTAVPVHCRAGVPHHGTHDGRLSRCHSGGTQLAHVPLRRLAVDRCHLSRQLSGYPPAHVEGIVGVQLGEPVLKSHHLRDLRGGPVPRLRSSNPAPVASRSALSRREASTHRRICASQPHHVARQLPAVRVQIRHGLLARHGHRPTVAPVERHRQPLQRRPLPEPHLVRVGALLAYQLSHLPRLLQRLLWQRCLGLGRVIRACLDSPLFELLGPLYYKP